MVESGSRMEMSAAAVSCQERKLEAVVSERISLIAIFEEAIPGIFSFDSDGVEVTSATPQQLVALSGRLSAFLGGEAGLVAAIVKAVGDNLGRRVAHLAGFAPVDSRGVDDVHFLRFGKIYMPEVEGCRAVFRLSRKQTQAADFKITLAGFGGGAGRTLWCQVGQEDELLASPKDLVIPIQARIITWRDRNGREFYTYSLVSYSRWISARPARNPYFGSSGFDYLRRTKGGSPVYGGRGVGELRRQITFGGQRSYGLKEILSLPSGWAFEVEGKVEVLSEMSALYALAPTHDYLLVEGRESPIEHYWAWKEAEG